jgi:hypothetical protein
VSFVFRVFVVQNAANSGAIILVPYTDPFRRLPMDWPAYFAHNQARRVPIPWEQGVHVEPALRGPLIRSLQRFQLGERGDGAHLKQVAATHPDPAYPTAVALFVAEEQEHAALMAGVIQGLQAPLLERHWSDEWFRLFCRVTGLHAELLVLLVAEIIAQRYFRVVQEATRDPVVQAVCTQILRDEDGHVAFHCATLQSVVAGWPGLFRRLVYHGWRLFFRAVCLVVLFDHRALLRVARIPPRVFWRDCNRLFAAAAAQVFAPTALPHRILRRDPSA